MWLNVVAVHLLMNNLRGGFVVILNSITIITIHKGFIEAVTFILPTQNVVDNLLKKELLQHILYFDQLT